MLSDKVVSEQCSSGMVASEHYFSDAIVGVLCYTDIVASEQYFSGMHTS